MRVATRARTRIPEIYSVLKFPRFVAVKTHESFRVGGSSRTTRGLSDLINRHRALLCQLHPGRNASELLASPDCPAFYG